jgi:hypothetical protein
LTTQTFTTLAQLLALGLRPDLQGPRTRGSLTEIGLDNIEASLPVTEFRPEIGNVPVARYFRVDAPQLQGRLGAERLGDLSPEQREILRVRNGEHGLEFFLDMSPEDAASLLPSVDHATVILGPVDDDGTLGIWTWFPGDVMGTFEARDGITDHPVNSVAVKLHNGQ